MRIEDTSRRGRSVSLHHRPRGLALCGRGGMTKFNHEGHERECCRDLHESLLTLRDLRGPSWLNLNSLRLGRAVAPARPVRSRDMDTPGAIAYKGCCARGWSLSRWSGES